MSDPKTLVELAAADLVGAGVVFCPNPKMALWSNHPKVFIDVATTGEGEAITLRTGHFYGMTAHARGSLFLEPEARAVLDVCRGLVVAMTRRIS